MENIKEIIAKNLVLLRKKNKLTQQALAEKLNYSDKAISRWEHAETLPDIETLCKICDIYGVSFEYLLQREQPESDAENPFIKRDSELPVRISITLIALCSVWLIASLSYMYMNVLFEKNYWTLFIWAIPASMIVLWVCNRLWGNRLLGTIIVSLLTWTLILSIYLQNLTYNLWMLFIIGVPIQAIIILSSNVRKYRGRGR